MLENLKGTGRTIGYELSRAWDVLSDGWREIFNRGGNALTHFGGAPEAPPPTGAAPASARSAAQSVSPLPTHPHWSLLAGEVEETADAIVVRLEVPGMRKEDCRVTIEGNRLILSGEKRFERSSEDSAYHVMERAYGAFQRVVALPASVIDEQAAASYENGVLSVRLPKRPHAPGTRIPVA